MAAKDDFLAQVAHKLRQPLHASRQIFHKPDEPVRHVVFLNGGVASITTVMSNGAMVEIATVEIQLTDRPHVRRTSVSKV